MLQHRHERQDVMVNPAYVRMDPFRPAASRWERADKLIFFGDRPKSRDDKLTRQVYQYQQSIGGRDCPPTCPKPRFALLRAAHQIYSDNGELRWEIEARLLSRQSIDEVARRLDLAPDLLVLYEQVFFTCLDRIDCSDWILINFIGNGPSSGFSPHDWRGIWRWVGYFGGPHALDLVVAATSKVPRQHNYTADELRWALKLVFAAQIPLTRKFLPLETMERMVEKEVRKFERASRMRSKRRQEAPPQIEVVELPEPESSSMTLPSDEIDSPKPSTGWMLSEAV
jgi:hypothetical protein